MERGRTLLDLVGLEQDLTELLGRKADVVVEGGISPYLEARILSEAIAI
jgi:predicted nucleotidyltransferase